MGNSFSEASLKAQVKLAIGRLNLLCNKQANEIKVNQRKIAELLSIGKTEIATIRVEGVIRDKNRILAMEELSMYLEMMAQRTALIASSRECPIDLIPAIVSIYYCSQRISSREELTNIVSLFASKFGKNWVQATVVNEDIVPKSIRDNLSVEVPSKKMIYEELRDITDLYDVDWEPPNLEDDTGKRMTNSGDVKAQPSVPENKSEDGEGVPDVDDLEARFAALKK